MLRFARALRGCVSQRHRHVPGAIQDRDKIGGSRKAGRLAQDLSDDGVQG